MQSRMLKLFFCFFFTVFLLVPCGSVLLQPAAAATAESGSDDAGAVADDSPAALRKELEQLKDEVQKMHKEADARKKLEISPEEKDKSAEDILSSAGRDYTLMKKGTLGLEYSFSYSYYSGDVIEDSAIVEQRSNHNLTNQVFVEYALRDNLTLNTGVPFVYKYNRVGTSTAQDATDFGDITLGVQMQPFKAGGDYPSAILTGGFTLPFGTSPYKIVPGEGQATGSGFYAANAGISLSKTMDPLVAFGNLGVTYNFAATGLDQNWSDGRNLVEVDPGSSVGVVLGLGYALSYKASLNLSTQFSYALGSEYHFSNASTTESGSTVSARFNIGTGWKVFKKQSVSVKLGIGLTSNDPDFTFSVRVPFEF